MDNSNKLKLFGISLTLLIAIGVLVFLGTSVTLKGLYFVIAVILVSGFYIASLQEGMEGLIYVVVAICAVAMLTLVFMLANGDFTRLTSGIFK